MSGVSGGREGNGVSGKEEWGEWVSGGEELKDKLVLFLASELRWVNRRGLCEIANCDNSLHDKCDNCVLSL